MRGHAATAVLSLAAALVFSIAFAAPGPGLESTAQELKSRIRLDMADLAEPRIRAHIDFARMTRAAAARSWHSATRAQQDSLTAEFRTLVLRTYVIAVAGRREHIVEFQPLRAAPADTEATLKSVLRLPGSTPLTLDYDMERVGAGWKITDIKLGGISLVANYRQVFARHVREDGMDGLVKALAESNRPGEGRARQQGQDLYVPVALAYATTARQIFTTALRGN